MPILDDQSLCDPNHDELGRRPFALGVARAIMGWHGNQSLVVSVEGPWGDGKSTVANFVDYYLRTEGKPIPIIIRFNPWEWSGLETVSPALLSVLVSQLHLVGESLQNTGRRGEGDDLLKVSKYLAELFGIVAPLGKMLGVLPEQVDGVAKFLKKVTEACDGKDGKDDGRIGPRGAIKDVGKVKDEIATILRRIQGNIVVFIDDIDRLTPHEIRTVFQTVKTHGDLPKLVFVMLFDRQAVESALEKSVGEGLGRPYLEKIVHVSMKLPVVRDANLRDAFVRRIGEVSNARHGGGALTHEDLVEIWNAGGARYLQSLRGIKRLTNAYDFHLGQFPDSRDVHPADFLILEMLRIHEPDVYSTIGRLDRPFGEDIATDPTIPDVPRHEDEDAERDAKRILGAVRGGEGCKDAVSNLWKYLKRDAPFFIGLSRDRNNRFAAPGSRRRYFLLGQPIDELSAGDFDSIRRALSAPEEFNQLMISLSHRGLAGEAAEWLTSPTTEDLDPHHVLPLILNLTDSYWLGAPSNVCSVTLGTIERQLPRILQGLSATWVREILPQQMRRPDCTFVQRYVLMQFFPQRTTAGLDVLRGGVSLDSMAAIDEIKGDLLEAWLLKVDAKVADPSSWAATPDFGGHLAMWSHNRPNEARRLGEHMNSSSDAALSLLRVLLAQEPKFQVLGWIPGFNGRAFDVLGRLNMVDDMRRHLVAVRAQDPSALNDKAIASFEKELERHAR